MRIVRINLSYSLSNLVDRHGNWYALKGSARVRNTKGVELLTEVYEVVFVKGGAQ
jgi:hypothetical protein